MNGRLATVAELAECGRRLVDLHGQHAHQSLLAPAEQRALLDRFAGAKAQRRARASLRAARAAARGVAEELAALGGDEQTRAREVDLLRYQVDEIDAAAIADADEDERLVAEEELLADAEAHREALATAYGELEGPGEDALGAAVAALAGRAPFAALADRMRALQSEMQEAAHDVRAAEESIVADPQRLQDRAGAPRAALRSCAGSTGRRSRTSSSTRERTRARLEELEQHDERAARLAAAPPGRRGRDRARRGRAVEGAPGRGAEARRARSPGTCASSRCRPPRSASTSRLHAATRPRSPTTAPTT